MNIQEYRLLIYAKGIEPERTSELFEFAKKHKNIVVFAECLGNWEYELSVEVESPQQVLLLTQEIYEKFGNSINSIKSVPILERLKFSLFPI